MTKPKINCIRLQSFPIFEQLQLEEALLRADPNNWLIISEGTDPSIVLGISGKPHLLLNEELIHERPIPIIRRFSGGGTVVVDEDTLFFTLICKHKDVAAPPFPKRILSWTEKLFAPLFEDSFSLRENDFVFDDKKFGGNAQTIIKDRWLHHTSFLWDFSKEKMNYLLSPERQPEYRSKRDHVDFLCSLKDRFSSKQELIEQMMEQVKNHFEIVDTPLEEALKALALPHRKSTRIVELSHPTNMSSLPTS